MFLLCNNNNNKNKPRSQWFTKFDLGGVINLVCHRTPSCGKKILAHISLEKVTHHHICEGTEKFEFVANSNKEYVIWQSAVMYGV